MAVIGPRTTAVCSHACRLPRSSASRHCAETSHLHDAEPLRAETAGCVQSAAVSVPPSCLEKEDGFKSPKDHDRLTCETAVKARDQNTTVPEASTYEGEQQQDGGTCNTLPLSQTWLHKLDSALQRELCQVLSMSLYYSCNSCGACQFNMIGNNVAQFCWLGDTNKRTPHQISRLPRREWTSPL